MSTRRRVVVVARATLDASTTDVEHVKATMRLAAIAGFSGASGTLVERKTLAEYAIDVEDGSRSDLPSPPRS